MSRNKLFILSSLGYFIVTMIIAVTWHMVLFHEKYVSMGAFTRVNPIMPLGMTAVILQAVVFSYFYPLYYKAKNARPSIKNGAIFSLLMGINVWTVMVFATGAKFNIEPIVDFILLGTCFQLLQFFFVGTAFGLLHKRFVSDRKSSCATIYYPRIREANRVLLIWLAKIKAVTKRGSIAIILVISANLSSTTSMYPVSRGIVLLPVGITFK